mgnify:CR=1 FL=1|tara:strand:- start:361 stop:477 length:117 start_codon:yes stop_codon:yes gene_type:complete
MTQPNYKLYEKLKKEEEEKEDEFQEWLGEALFNEEEDE